MKLQIGQCSLRGPSNPVNTDEVRIVRNPNVTACLITTALGHDEGTASRLAVEVVAESLNGCRSPVSRESITSEIRKAIVHANEAIIVQGASGRKLKNIGATLILLAWYGIDEVLFAGVGDSRAYLIRDQKVIQLTKDDVVAPECVTFREDVSREQIEALFKRGVLWKYLGSKEVGREPPVGFQSLQPADRLVLTTYGISQVGPLAELLAEVGKETEPQRCAAALCQLALERGARDNVSCIVIAVE